MDGTIYEAAYLAIDAVFKYHAEIMAFRAKKWLGAITVPWLRPLHDFHMLVYNGITLDADTLSAKFLQQFNLFELRDILTLYIIRTPARWKYEIEVPGPAAEHRQVTRDSEFDHFTIIVPALSHLRDTIANMGDDHDELKNSVDLIRRNNILANENESLKKQLAIIKNVISRED